MVDVVCVNRYFGWYTERGRPDLAAIQIERELRNWRGRFGRPIIMTEFGADTIAGLHRLPGLMFTEEYQREFMETYFAVFDKLDFVVGEHIWNFADFMCKESVMRAQG